ncbi:peptidoglycan-binding protein [Candidatus Omnitrophota bacterium]
MLRRTVLLAVLLVFLFSLTGCASWGRKKDLQIHGLKNEVSVLKSQLSLRDEEIRRLGDDLDRLARAKQLLSKSAGRKAAAEVKSRSKPKDIQLALKNAGYDPGPIDGEIGAKTRDAVKAFQADNNLNVDGKVGKETWKVLRDYLYRKTK